jgi:hypothetical protein
VSGSEQCAGKTRISLMPAERPFRKPRLHFVSIGLALSHPQTIPLFEARKHIGPSVEPVRPKSA